MAKQYKSSYNIRKNKIWKGLVFAMVKFILGEKGVGKTKWLIENANNDIKEGNNNIVFIDVDDNHIFTLDYSVRLINAVEFNVSDIESFYGFLCGIIAMNYDVKKIYVDGIYKIMNIGKNELRFLLDRLGKMGDKFHTKFYINVEYNLEDIPKDFESYCIKLEN